MRFSKKYFFLIFFCCILNKQIIIISSNSFRDNENEERTIIIVPYLYTLMLDEQLKTYRALMIGLSQNNEKEEQFNNLWVQLKLMRMICAIIFTKNKNGKRGKKIFGNETTDKASQNSRNKVKGMKIIRLTFLFFIKINCEKLSFFLQ